MSLHDWVAALESSAFAEWMRGSATAYPAANLVHLLGLTLLIGPILLLDLRLLGFGRSLALAVLYRTLSAWAAVGIALLLIGGFAMFAADAAPLSRNPMMQLKLTLIAFGIGNALLFRFIWREHISLWDERPPVTGRLQAAVSLLVWLTAAALGRLIAYS